MVAFLCKYFHFYGSLVQLIDEGTGLKLMNLCANSNVILCKSRWNEYQNLTNIKFVSIYIQAVIFVLNKPSALSALYLQQKFHDIIVARTIFSSLHQYDCIPCKIVQMFEIRQILIWKWFYKCVKLSGWTCGLA